MMTITVNGKKIEAVAGDTVLTAALRAGIYIPNLCYHPDVSPSGACRLCIVEVEGGRGFPASCTTPVRDGMVVRSDTPRIKELRQNLLWLILSEHPVDVAKASQLRKVADYIGIRKMPAGHTPRTRKIPVAADNPLIVRDMDRCVLCGRCVRVCRDMRKTGAIGFVNRGLATVIGTPYDIPLGDAGCRFCTTCIEICPSGALRDARPYEEKDRVKTLLPCSNTCPARIDISRYVRLIALGRFQDALEVIREKVPFPETLGYVCDHPCEGECRRGQVNEPMSVKALKRFVAQRDTGRWRSKLKVAPPTGKKVAVVGSGPAGLTAAWFLQKAGHAVTVFEALEQPGGMLRIGIPEYRLPREVLDREIGEIVKLGARIETHTRIESLDKLFADGFDAVFMGLGAMKGAAMGVPGEDHARVLDGIAVLQAINTKKPVDLSGDVAVLGGGNVAIDVARSSLRMGARKVTILYRRTRDEMPAEEGEVEEALHEGVEILFLVAPQAVSATADKLHVQCVRMELGEPDASGRRKPVPVQGSEFAFECDKLVTAIGQKTVAPSEFSPLMTNKGLIGAAPETMACPREGVFAGGDAVSGPASVIKAIAAGRKAASSIDKYLGGTGEIDQELVRPEDEPACLGREEGFAQRQRAQMPCIPLAQRQGAFTCVELGLDEQTAAQEAQRCLRCEMRLKITKAPLPPNA